MKPYVYIIQNLEQTHWYVGMRYANKCTANEDTKYWGSSDYLDELIAQTGKDQWTKTIIKEFDTKHDANEFEQLMLKFMWDWDGRVNKARNGFVDMSDPEVKGKHKAATTIANKKKAQDPVYRANHLAGCQKNAQNPEWIKNHKASKQKMAQDPVWQVNHKAASQKRAQDPVYRANHNAAMKKLAKPFIATCIKTGEEYYCESGVCEQAKALELHPGTVSECLNGKRKQHKGFTFRYV